MNTDKYSIWLKSTFTKNSLPEWNCPTCNGGKLILQPAKLLFEETALSKSYTDEPGWDFEWIRLRFVGLLECTNKNCEESISFSGEGSVEYNRYFGEDEYHPEEPYEVFKPLYFSPPLNLFNLAEKYPATVKKEIATAFGLYWNDASSCANKIRVALELLMDDLKIIRYTTRNGKRTSLSLHKRLEKFKVKNSDIADHLLAIKWIGNSGSHVGKIEKVDLIDAFKLLEHSLEKIYNTQEKQIKKLTQNILKKKGPVSSKGKLIF